jgi:hypothetical protein
MTHSTHNPGEFALPLPITQIAQDTAQRFASQQFNPEKVEQVRLNTLAVYVVNDYLQLMGIATNLASSDIHNAVVQLSANVSDLEVSGLGRLECRPMHPLEQTCYIPPEVWHDRIGYVVIQFDEAAQQAMMVGFSATAVEHLPLHQLAPPEALLDHLHELSQSPQERSVPTAQPLVNLSQWFQDVFETGWQAIDALLNPPELGLAYRGYRWMGDPNSTENRIGRAKLINLGFQLTHHTFALVVELSQRPDAQVRIYLRLHPAEGAFLPSDLRLAVLDSTGAVLVEARSRNADNYLQLELSGQAGEHFNVQVSLGEASITESFVI